jgi:endonuclease V-like protein UPF0215 family
VDDGKVVATARFLPPRPHVLGIDDGPFEKFAPGAEAPLVGVMMEGPDLVEAVALTRFPVDGDGVTGFLGGWIEALRFREALHAVLFGGITLAGLALLDPEALARRLDLPVLVLNRKPPRNERLREALRTAGLEARIAQLESAPESFAVGDVHVSASGASREEAKLLLARTRGKSALPEALRVAHLIARALATGQSRGRA